MNTLIIIPALNPDKRLIKYVEELQRAGLNQIIVVDDGSDDDKQPIFERLREMNCRVLRHIINMGKGRALKDAFNYVLTASEFAHNLGGVKGVITVDSDGQHTVRDVLKVREALDICPESLILGARDFSAANVPPKSRFGNQLTRWVIKLFYGGNISDTQTGLRGIPLTLLPRYLALFGEMFEYETNMLIESLRIGIPIQEVKIETVYEEQNKGTHFRPVKDSIRIYALILGTFFKASGLSSGIIDLGLFIIFTALLAKSSMAVTIWVSTIGARILSSLYDYRINKRVVFRGEQGTAAAMAKYYTLAVLQMCASAGLVTLFSRFTGFPALAEKIAVDAVLFFISFQMQQRWVFKVGGQRQ